MDYSFCYIKLVKLFSFMMVQIAVNWDHLEAISLAEKTVHGPEIVVPQELSCQDFRKQILLFTSKTSLNLLPCSSDNRSLNYTNNIYSNRSMRNYKIKYYKLYTKRKTLYLQLDEINNGFLAPNFYVEKKYGDLYSESSYYTDNSCFYNGKAFFDGYKDKNENLIKVTLNTCGGLQGVIGTTDGEYFIQPININQTTASREHFLYAPTLKADSEERQLKCGNKVSRKKKAQKIYHKFEFTFSSEKLELVPSKKRVKRALSVQRYIETMVVADESMFVYYGKEEVELRRYLLSIMAIVTNIMKDHSIGNSIDVSVVKLVILKENPSSLDVSGKASHILKRFCKWQKRENKLNDDDPEHYDAAVLITRKNLCSSRDKCDTLGLAELGSVCDPIRSCAIVEDNGLSVAFTIAHELGHLINAPHDGENNECGTNEPANIMTPTFSVNLNSWKWSSCSRKHITEFVESSEALCLLDKPSPKFEYPLPLKLPGEMFSKNEQCQFIYGEASYACPFMRKCNRIWCVRNYKGTKACHTNNMPWADGTKCEADSWCIHGECRLREKIKLVNGQWSDWSPYSSCSRPCGGGIKIATRECDNPKPENGGDYCIGHRQKYKSCNIQECQKSLTSFRADQCQSFNGKDLGIPGVPANTEWLPKLAGVDSTEQCKLFCEIKGYNGLWYELARKVIDGTKCSKGNNDICVDGQCKPAGCDHVLNSDAKYDNCGVCNGDNSTCITYVGYKNTTHLGYNSVVHIPQGAFQVNIIQESAVPGKHDTNFLALVDDRKQYVFNGEWRVSLGKRRYNTYGTSIHYSGPNEMIEEIIVPGVLTTALEIRVLSIEQSNSVNIRYSYKFPVRGAQKYKWALQNEWSQCYPVCQGYQIQDYECQREIDSQVVAPSKCTTKKPQELHRVCNLKCNLRWEVLKDECVPIHLCGFGIQKQKVICKKSHIEDTKKDETLSHTDCLKARVGEMPTREIPCYSPCTRVRWVYTAWSTCNATCGGGTQSRKAFCVDQTTNSTLHDDSCQNTTIGTLVRSCNTYPCPKWHTGAWAGVCSVTCGDGIVERLLTCVVGGKTVPLGDCDATKKPHETRPCVMSACASWKTRAWSKCSEPCGNGYNTREVYCETSAGEKVPDSECNEKDKPVDRKICFEKSCEVKAKVIYNDHVDTNSLGSFKWLTGVWSECSSSCGGGYRSRIVECVSNNIIVKEENCASSPKPATKEFCNTFSCPFWRHGAWSKCTKHCGKGSQTRLVLCGYNGTIVADNWCAITMKPHERRFCNTNNCETSSQVLYLDTPLEDTNWKTEEWSECSTTCGSGFKKRNVFCKVNKNCKLELKPRDLVSCDSGPCPGWNYGQWTPCYTEKGCGPGWQARLVVCQLENGSIIRNTDCDMNYKPSDNKTCEDKQCKNDARWSITPWQPCNVPCGNGTQFRYISCEDAVGNEIPEPRCMVYEAKPIQEMRCHREVCPDWHFTDWDHCDSTCHQQRVVVCRSGEENVNENLCKLDKKPLEMRECSNENCVKELHYKWTHNNWSPCGKTCGYSLRSREVVCTNDEDRIVENAFCKSLSNKPTVVEQCFEGLCPPEWHAENWNECSVSCGDGMKTRNVLCRDEGGIIVEDQFCKKETKLQETESCFLGDCGDEYRWVTGLWKQCSKTCGIGQTSRELYCYNSNNETQPPQRCNKDNRPANMKICNTHLCPHTSCRDIQIQLNVKFDGEQTIEVGNHTLLVYCEGMHRTNPKEYITLKADPKENYAEIYGKRLSDAKECPHEGQRQIPCGDCVDYTASGITFFKKVRLDIKRFTIVPEDKTFTDRFGRNPPGFASAGDCYSAAKCPQGRFMLNLIGTGLRIADNVEWTSRGYYTSQKIRRHKNSQVVYGKCGGYCGMCSPDNKVGLKVEIHYHKKR